MTGVYIQMKVGLWRQCDGFIYTNEGRIDTCCNIDWLVC